MSDRVGLCWPRRRALEKKETAVQEYERFMNGSWRAQPLVLFLSLNGDKKTFSERKLSYQLLIREGARRG